MGKVTNFLLMRQKKRCYNSVTSLFEECETRHLQKCPCHNLKIDVPHVAFPTCPTSVNRRGARRFFGGESMPRVYEEYQRRNEHWRHWQSRRIAGLVPLSYKDDVLPMGIWMIICGLIRILRKMKKKWKHDSAFGFLCYLCNKSKLFVGVADRMGDW